MLGRCTVSFPGMAARLPPRVPSFAMTGAVGVQPLVLLVNEEPSTQRLLVSALASHGFRCLRAVTKTDALIRALKLEPDLVLLDSGPKGVDAVGITARLREWTSAPILVLLPRSQSRERTALLDAGASDYVVKTVGTSDLVARMRVWLRQQRRRGRQEPGAERLRIDHERRLLLVDGREIHLTPIECKVLLALARRPGAWMKEAQILAAVWGKGSRTSARHLHAHVRRLRDKMERDPARPDHLVTETHGGYRLKLG
jgi:two-component system KDP operon response regulator KdpE